MYTGTSKTKFKITIITPQNKYISYTTIFNRYVIEKKAMKINYTDFHIKKKKNMSLSDSIKKFLNE